MNLLTTNQIIDPSIGEPFTGPMLSYLQDSYNEVIAAIGQNLTGIDTFQPNVPYALYGCELTVISSTNFALTPGYILYNNIIYKAYLPPALTPLVLTSGVSNCIFTITTNYPTTIPSFDPVTFTDGLPRYVTQNNVAIPSSSTAITNNATAFNYSSIVWLIKPNLSTFFVTAPGASSVNHLIYTTIPGFSFTTPNDGITRTYNISFKTAIETSGAAAVTILQAQLLNVTTSTPIDYLSIGKTPAASGDILYIGGSMMWFGTIPPGQQIDVQVRYSSTSVTFAIYDTALSIIEVR